MSPDIRGRLAGAPISWGICEVPDWGHQLDPDRVLAEMRAVGLAATELGPAGFLPAHPNVRAELLDRYGLAEVGGFVPVVLHEAGRDPVAEIDTVLAGFRPGQSLVLAAATGLDGYDRRPELDEPAWTRLLTNLDRIAARAAAAGCAATLHPHVGTMVERREEVARVLRGSSIPLCLDTGHLLIGGTDPVELAVELTRAGAADGGGAGGARVGHVHLKDVDAALAGRVRDGAISYTEAVRTGIYRPLGAGDIDIPRLVAALEGAGYRGWYVLEQDTVLTAAPPEGVGPIDDVRSSLAFLERTLA